MATPNRNLILEDIATSLGAIDGTGSFTSTVTTVERVIKDWQSVGAQEMPWLGFAPIRTAYTMMPFGQIECTMDVTIVGIAQASTDSTRSDTISELVDDVIYALGIDATRGGNAVSTSIVSCETDEGDPDTMDSRGGTCGFVMGIQVRYDRTSGST